MEVDVKVTGLDELEQIFNSLAVKDKRNILINAFRKATRPTIDAAKSNLLSVAQRRSGDLYKSIGFVPLRNEVAAIVGARIRGSFRGYHAHLIEEGTYERFRKTKGNASTGRMKYTGFFKKAVDSTEEKVFDTVAQEWFKAIEKYIAKHK